MKVKVADLYDLSLGLGDLADKDLPISTSLKVQRNQKNVSDELIPSDKVRQEIMKKHKEKDLGEGVVKLNKKGIKEMNELMEQDVEVELQNIETKDLEGIKIKPRSLTLLEKILNVDDAEK